MRVFVVYDVFSKRNFGAFFWNLTRAGTRLLSVWVRSGPHFKWSRVVGLFLLIFEKKTLVSRKPSSGVKVNMFNHHSIFNFFSCDVVCTTIMGFLGSADFSLKQCRIWDFLLPLCGPIGCRSVESSRQCGGQSNKKL